MNPIIARLLQTAAVFISAKLIEALVKELSVIDKKIKKKHPHVMTHVMQLIQGGKA